MPDNQYPAFEGGQTLTAAELNQLRTFLHERDRSLGRLVGFGVACGLGGTVTTSGSTGTLTIAPGLAVDQRGEPLVLAVAQTVPLPVAATGGTFDFVTAAPGRFSVVLEAVDEVAPAPDCGQTDCQGHAELHTRRAVLRVVAGQVTGARFDFAGETLLAQEPMRLSATSTANGDYSALRTAIATRLRNNGTPLISATLISRLEGTSLAVSDLPGVQGYKAGFVNQVLFATLDLLRCRALQAVSCLRTTTRPGVVLGCLTPSSGGAWGWDSRYRHGWEPLPGLSQALLAGTGGDPCGLYVDVVEGLIAGYKPPDAPTTTVVDGDGVVFPYCPQGMVVVNGECANVYYPPETIRPEWIEVFEIDPLGPIWNPPEGPRERLDRIVEQVYQGQKWGYFGEGVVTVTTAVGHEAQHAAAALGKRVTELGGTPNVQVVTENEAPRMAGYQPAGTVNLVDTVVLTAGADGRVVATGRVPAAHTARTVGTELPAAKADAAEAVSIATKQQGQVTEVAKQVTGMAEQVKGLGSFRESTVAWRGTVDGVLGSLDEAVAKQIDARVDAQVGDSLRELDRRVATVEGSVDVLSKTRAVGVSGERRIDQDAARGMVEFAETVNAGLATMVTAENERTLGRYVTQATNAAANLEVVAAGGEPVAIAEATLTLLGNLRTAVKSAGVEPAVGRQLDAQYAAVKGLLG